MCCLLLWLILHIKARIHIFHLSIPGIVAHGWCYISHCFFFFFTVSHVVLLFFKCIINLTSFLFKSNFISFPICDSALLLSHYYYCYTVIITIFIPYYKQIYIHIDIYFVFLSTCSVSTCSLIQ